MRRIDNWEELPANYTGHIYSSDDESEFWLYKGVLHRDDGPAIIQDTGEKHWYQHSRYHRVDGPAFQKPNNGGCIFFINGAIFSQENFWKHPLVVKNTLSKILSISL